MSASLYANIPEELRLLKQWVLWKYEDIGASKPTKVPYHPNGRLADVTDPSTWSTFNEVHSSAKLGAHSGIGFIFSHNDPYTFIDLDDAEGDDAVLQRHLKVYHEFETYAEVSPSGKGLHLICKGTVPAGRRRSKIEIYPHARYATMTGNVYQGRNSIIDCQSQLSQLWEQMGSGPVAQSLYNGTDKETDTDDVIIKKASDAVNGDKFVKLLKGEWQDIYSSQSEADFAFIDMLAFYTQNRNQITRLFRSSPLGFRDKAKRNDYVSGMIHRSFDRMLPPLDFDGLKNAIELKIANGSVAQRLEPAAHNGSVAGSNPVTATTKAVSYNGNTTAFDAVNLGSIPNAASIELPPGLVGDIASFIYQAAPRPVQEVALAAAIGLMAGITGRAYNISGTGLNQYILLLAMTGAGKEAAAEGIDKLISLIRQQVPTASTYIGPGEISSGTALIRHLSNISQSFVSLLGEFGLRLQQISSANANGAEISLRRMLLDLYNKSGHSRNLPASAYAKKEDSSMAIPSPAVSFIGESTPERFYGILNEDMISEGLLPRFLLIEYKGNRPALNEQHTSVTPSFSLIERLSALVAQCETVTHANPRRVINVQSSPEAEKMLRDFDKYSDDKINGSNKDVIRQLWNRAHMKVLKLSAIIAVGENMIEPIISAHAMLWAANLVQADITALTERFETGEVGKNSFELKQQQDMIRVIKEYLDRDVSYIVKYQGNPVLHKDKIVSHTYLSTRLTKMASFRNDKAGETVALKRTINNLVDNGKLIVAGGPEFIKKYGTTQKSFHVHPSLLD